ncbi:MAG: hypothetical protein ABI905_05765 [Betaproteobacteria bacterium]
MAIFPHEYREHSIFPRVTGPFKGPWEASFVIYRNGSNGSALLVCQGVLEGEYASIDAAYTAAHEEAMRQLRMMLEETHNQA